MVGSSSITNLPIDTETDVPFFGWESLYKKLRHRFVSGDSVSCTFNYLLMLGIVTVETKLNLTDEKLSGEALQADNILSHLYQVKLSSLSCFVLCY